MSDFVPHWDSPETKARHSIELGQDIPYDAGREFFTDMVDARPATDWAHEAARGIFALFVEPTEDLGLDDALEALDHDVRARLVADVAEIIRVSAESKMRFREMLAYGMGLSHNPSLGKEGVL